MSVLTDWDWKTEPESPAFSVLNGTEDVWLFDEGNVVKQLEEEDVDEILSQPPTRAQVAAKLLKDLDEFAEEETYSDWLEEKIDIPIFEDIPPVDLRPKYKSLDTQLLLQEFECIYGEVELNNGALTPPQSPPLSPIYVQEPESTAYVQTEPVLHALTIPDEKIVYTVDNSPGLVFANPFSSLISQRVGYSTSNVDDVILLPQQTSFSEIPATPQPDFDLELAVVEELVRTRAEDMDTSSDPWEIIASSPESIMSPPETSSDSSNCAAEYTSDVEWIPETVHSPKAASAAPKRKRGKPYARPIEDKRLRKKEQNKNAATRYRQKKKQEVEVILDEEKILEDKNADLHEKATDLQREIKYLKGLMRDLFKAKGLIK